MLTPKPLIGPGSMTRLEPLLHATFQRRGDSSHADLCKSKQTVHHRYKILNFTLFVTIKGMVKQRLCKNRNDEQKSKVTMMANVKNNKSTFKSLSVEICSAKNCKIPWNFYDNNVIKNTIKGLFSALNIDAGFLRKMVGAQYGPAGTRFSILGTRIGSLKHLKKNLR